MTVAERVAEVRANVASAARRAGRDPAAVTLVAVSKEIAPDLIVEAVQAGQHDFGENRAQELEQHAGAADPAHELRWHFVGRLQRNKVKRIAPLVSLWQSVDRAELAPVLAKHVPGAHTLVQVNVADEPQKAGCTKAEAAAVVDELRTEGLVVDGLMTVPPAAGDPRPYFDTLRELGAGLGLTELSMGMSGDYERAIEAGATIVRVGTAIFGVRRGLPGPSR